MNPLKFWNLPELIGTLVEDMPRLGDPQFIAVVLWIGFCSICLIS